MHNKGQIYVHDIRKAVLLQAKQRLRRAGVQNAQVHSDKVRLRQLLKGRCDWVLLDVPCSGSGVLRRNPDLKWKFSIDRMQELLKVQELILDESMAYLKDVADIQSKGDSLGHPSRDDIIGRLAEFGGDKRKATQAIREEYHRKKNEEAKEEYNRKKKEKEKAAAAAS